MAANYRLVAIQVGEALKGSTTLKEIGRIASAIFRFQRESFPNPDISSERALAISDWVLSLAKQSMPAGDRDRLLVEFCRNLTPENERSQIDAILADNGIALALLYRDDLNVFESRTFHPVVVENARRLFCQANHFHAVFECAKAYNKLVRQKAQSEKDGQGLMLGVWGADNGVLKVTRCENETDRNVQDGIKFLSAGLMQAIRNPTAHEPALDWPITKEDCLDILSFISFLLRQLDKAVYVARVL